MPSDATFLIGAGHEICQDWAAAGEHRDGCWALICDGCSGAPRSDFGARLIGHAAALELERGSLCPSQVLDRAAEQAALLGLDPRSLDATLWAVWQEGDLLRVFGSGDGVVVARRRDGVLVCWSVEHLDNAPAYLSYLVDPDRLCRYLADHGLRRVTHRVDGRVVSRADAHLTSAPFTTSWTFEAARYPTVAVMSDGVRALRDCDREPIGLADALEELLAFKRLRGRFVRRRVRGAIKRRRLELGDDLAMAAVVSASTSRQEAA